MLYLCSIQTERETQHLKITAMKKLSIEVKNLCGAYGKVYCESTTKYYYNKFGKNANITILAMKVFDDLKWKVR